MQTSSPPQNVAPTGTTPSNISVLVEQIISLVDKVNSIDNHFLEVQRHILVNIPFDPNNDFARYHKKYLELIWKSREIAGRAGVAGEDFCGDLLDLMLLNTNSSKEEKIRELEIAMGSWHTDGEQYSQLSYNLKELSDTLKAFRTTFSDRVARAREEMPSMRPENDQLRAEIGDMGVSGKSTFFQNPLSWMPQYFLGSMDALGGQHVTSKEDLPSQISILEEDLCDIQLVIDKRDNILAEVDAITDSMDSLSNEVTSLSAILNLMTCESTELLAVMRSGDAHVEYLGAQIVTLREEFSPIRKSLALYARAQKS